MPCSCQTMGGGPQLVVGAGTSGCMPGRIPAHRIYMIHTAMNMVIATASRSPVVFAANFASN